MTATPPPPVTVVVPVYNGLPWLREAVASILAQSFGDFALLAVDDGSTDGSAEWLATIADPRVEVVRNERNLGLCATLNAAYARARSELVARLDQDDAARPGRLAAQVAYLRDHPEAIGVFSTITRIGETGRDFGAYARPGAAEVEPYDPHPDRHFSIVHSASCFRRAAVLAAGGYRAELYPADDYDLTLRLLERGPLAVLREPLVRYRIHGGAATFATFRTMQQRSRYARAMHERRAAGLPETPLAEFAAAESARSALARARGAIAERGMLYFRQAGLYAGQGRRARAAAALAGALALNPLFALRRLRALRPSPR